MNDAGHKDFDMAVEYMRLARMKWLHAEEEENGDV